MKLTKRALTSAVAASVLATGAIAPMAHAEVSASVGVASTYLWRGIDLGSGTPAVSGELGYATAGFYTGIWGSSGDTGAGTEYDLFVGYGTSFGEDDLFSIDVSLWNYVYPTVPGEPDFFDLSELVVAFGVGPVALTIYENVAGASGYRYATLGGTWGDFALTVGVHDNHRYSQRHPDDDDIVDSRPVHVDLTYAYNDNLSFTFSQFVADEPADDNLKFVVSYSMPIGN